jgi:transcriptional regulator with XRE-family HTH domain
MLNKNYGIGIRAARAALGWSQDELASRAGLSRPTVNRVECSGSRTKSVDAILTAMPDVQISVSDHEVVIRVKV